MEEKKISEGGHLEMRDIFFSTKKKKGKEGGSVLPLNKAMQGSRILYYLDLLQSCISGTPQRFFPPRPAATKPRTAETPEVCCCRCQSHIWTKRLKKIKNKIKKHWTSSADYETKYLIYLWSTCSSTCRSFVSYCICCFLFVFYLCAK